VQCTTRSGGRSSRPNPAHRLRLLRTVFRNQGSGVCVVKPTTVVEKYVDFDGSESMPVALCTAPFWPTCTVCVACRMWKASRRKRTPCAPLLGGAQGRKFATMTMTMTMQVGSIDPHTSSSQEKHTKIYSAAQAIKPPGPIIHVNSEQAPQRAAS
jgi:hypothetical protein